MKEVPKFDAKVPTQALIKELGKEIQAFDVKLASLFDYRSPTDALQEAFDHGRVLFIATMDEKPFSAIVVMKTGFMGGSGMIWMMASDKIKDYPIAVLRKGKRVMDKIIQGYSYLDAYMHPANQKAKDYAKFLGFSPVMALEGIPDTRVLKGQVFEIYRRSRI